MPEEIKRKRILHIDDEQDILDVVKTILEKEGFDVVSVNTGIRGLNKIKMDGFSLIILDVMMPDISGWDLFTRISTMKPGYKIVFLSILELTKEKSDELKEAGIKDYIQKPFDVDDFVKRIKKAIKSK